jgi:hypothetical protein
MNQFCQRSRQQMFTIYLIGIDTRRMVQLILQTKNLIINRDLAQ